MHKGRTPQFAPYGSPTAAQGLAEGEVESVLVFTTMPWLPSPHPWDRPQVYNERGLLEKVEPVPFRLTRNLTTFFTAFGVEGAFTAAMANAAQALTHKNSNAQHFLALFFR